jgi:hypothetical protein
MYSRRFRGRQGSLTAEEVEIKSMCMSWRRMLRAVYWESMEEEEIHSKAEEITRALRRTQKDPQKIGNENLKEIIKETYEELDS